MSYMPNATSAVPPLNAVVARVTARITQRSAPTRQAYLKRLETMAQRPPGPQRMGCANVAHAVAALPGPQKLQVVAARAPHIGVVTAYNDMLSAHAPYEAYPAWLRAQAERCGATLQVAGGVPAMCDGITQGLPGMELSLFSRDTIAMATAVSLSHDVFDAALLLGVCDKIIPGLLIGALHFGHLPCVFVPAGPMSTGLSNKAKSQVRERFAAGQAGREELLAAESAAYHGQGTCTFYGTANSNQMLLEAMGLHVPGAAFAPALSGLREALTLHAVRTVLAITRSARFMPIGKVVDERCIVNAMAALLATGGSTNHLIHWVAVARAAGIVIDWNDFSELSAVVPLLARVYPNGEADVNAFQAAGGPAWVLRELLRGGYLHADVNSVAAQGLTAFTQQAVMEDAALTWRDLPEHSTLPDVVRPITQPFAATGGLALLQGNLGRAVIKVSAVAPEHHLVQAPARVFDSQGALLAAHAAGALECDFIAVVRFQGPQANGMPELHKLTPVLAVLQDKGFKVALVTDGRMSGASGKVPAAMHVSPEASAGGPLARVREGDMLQLDAANGTLNALVDDAEWQSRGAAAMPAANEADAAHGWGRELFAGMRRNVLSAEEGACTWL
jgi:phosphogluconate dehydratase